MDTSALDNLMLEDSHYEEAMGYAYMRNLLTTLPAGSRSLYLVMSQLANKALGTPYNDVLGKQALAAGITKAEQKKLREEAEKVALPMDSATGIEDDEGAEEGKRHIYNERYVVRRRSLPAPVINQLDADRKALLEWLDKKIAKTGVIEPSPFINNLRTLGKELQLSAEEVKMLEFSYVVYAASEFGSVATTLCDSTTSKAKFLTAAFLGMTPNQLNKLLEPKGRIRSMYLLQEHDSFDMDVDGSMDGPNTFFRLEESTAEMLSEPAELTGERIKNFFCGELLTSKLKIEDFRAVVPNIDQVVTMVRNAVEQKTPGMSFLLYGPPGTGKTSLVKAIAAEVGIELYNSGMAGEGTEIESSGGGDSALSNELTSGLNRMRKLRRTLLVLKEHSNVAVLTDEFVDLFARGTDGKSKPTSKLLMQDLIETNTIPVFYTTHETGEMPESVLDRMIPLYVGVPPTLVRARIWQNVLAEQKFEMPADDLLQLAREFAAPPRVITFAVREARLKGGDMDTIRRSIRDKALLRTNDEHSFDVVNPLHEKFRADFMSASADHMGQLDALAAQARSNDKRWSVLIHGPDASGKTSMGRYLLEQGYKNHVELDLRDFDNIYQLLEILPKALTFCRSNNDALMLKHVELVQSKKDMWPQVVKMLMAHPAPLILTAGQSVDMNDAAMKLLTTRKWQTQELAEGKTVDALKHFFKSAGAANDNEFAEAVTSLRNAGNPRIGDFALAASFGQWHELASLPEITSMISQSREVSDLGRPGKGSTIGFGPGR